MSGSVLVAAGNVSVALVVGTGLLGDGSISPVPVVDGALAVGCSFAPTRSGAQLVIPMAVAPIASIVAVFMPTSFKHSLMDLNFSPRFDISCSPLYQLKTNCGYITAKIIFFVNTSFNL